MRRIMAQKIKKLAIKRHPQGSARVSDYGSVLYEGAIREYRNLKRAYNRRPDKTIPFEQWALTA